MPAEASSATVLALLAGAVVAVVFLPLVLLALSPFVVGKILFARRTPAHRRGGWYTIE